MWYVILSNLFHNGNALDFLTLERFPFFFFLLLGQCSFVFVYFTVLGFCLFWLQEISLCNIASHAFSITKPHYIPLPIADLANQSFHRFSALRQGIPFRYIPQKHQTWRRKNPRKEITKAENTYLLISFWLSFHLVWENIASLQCIARQHQSVINTIIDFSGSFWERWSFGSPF